ncbi:glycosyltransferase family 4 protein [Candidatus Saccharibacteria bacterium CG_4_10_14_0_2_um_filter_52_9]|nr:MAG: glycosyltransferase family 4 protein [Candidatus Saccharibacteria bacterium CG_4_10_14_0_2_um_filter_52_9]
MKVAIVCDWLTGIGGAERVVLELHKMHPEAPIYTSQYDPSAITWFEDADIRTTWLQKLPKSLKKFLPLLRAWAFSRLDLSEYDLVISSSGAEAKGVKTGPNTTHICYCHAPTHYYWIRHDEYLQNPGFARGLNWLARLGLKLMTNPLRRWDRRAAKQPDYIIANSTYTQAMIKRYYKRDSTVIHPPVETERFKLRSNATALRHGFVVAGRQTPYKRFDLAIEACKTIKQPLIVIGDGPDHKRLEKLAGRSTTFLSNVNDNDIVEHFQTALGFILPNMDDFGIVAVEAQAAGTPVIAYNKGGAQDYVTPGKTGLFFDRQTVKNLSSTLETAAAKNFDYEAISKHAELFSTAAFGKSMRSYIKQHLAERS